MLAAATVVLAVATGASAQSIAITIVQPAANAATITSNQLAVVVTVTSQHPVQSVTASVADRQTALTFSQSQGYTGTVDLAGLPHGTHVLTIVATDVMAQSTSATRTFSLDRLPIVTVIDPLQDTVSRGTLRIRASCSDDGPAGCKSLTALVTGVAGVFGSGISEIDHTSSVVAVDGLAVDVVITGTDSANRETIVHRTVHVDSSPGIREVLTVAGRILDFDATKVLHVDPSDPTTTAMIRDRITGVDTSIPAVPGKPAAYGFLTPRGAFFVLGGPGPNDEQVFEFRDGTMRGYGLPNSLSSLRVRGSYAIWMGERGPTYTGAVYLFLRDVANETLVEIANAGNYRNDVAANGDVVYWDKSYRVHRYRAGGTLDLPHVPDWWETYPATDGVNVAYRRHQSENNYSTTLYTDGQEVVLDGPGSEEPVPIRDYQLENGWTAFTRRDSSGVRQTWTRGPNGVLRQLSFSANRTSVNALNSQGDTIFEAQGRRYLVTAGTGSLPVAISRLGEWRWVDGAWYVAIGRSIFRLGAQGSCGCSFVWDGESGASWATPQNWADDVLPASTDSLIFAAAAATPRLVTNDLPATTFGSIMFTRSGFTLGGSAVTLNNGITTSHTSGTSTIGLAVTLAAAQTFNTATGGTLAFNGSGAINTNGFALRLDSVGTSLQNLEAAVSGSGGLTKSGTGTVILAASNTYSGATTIDGGRLNINGSQPSSAVTVNSGGTLGGSGTIGALSVAAAGAKTISPGAASGVTAMTAVLRTLGNAALGAGSVGATPATFDVQLRGLDVGTYDQLDVQGTVTLGNATLTVAIVTGASFPIGAAFTIVRNDGADGVNGVFNNLPEAAIVLISGKAFQISYRGGDGNDVVLTDAEVAPNPIVTITSPTNSPATTGSSPFLTIGGTTVTADGTGDGPPRAGVVSVAWISNRGFSGTATGTTVWHADVPLLAGANVITVSATDAGGHIGIDTLTVIVTNFIYYLAEGATGPFFDLQLALANPTTTAASVDILFLKGDGTTVARNTVVPAASRITVLVDALPGLADTPVSMIVTSVDAIPLAVERTMRWDTSGYGSHTEKATAGAHTTWLFAEGSEQAIFDTYLLLANPQPTANRATVTFLVESDAPVVRVYDLPPTSRINVFAGAIPELKETSFGMAVTFDRPGIAERAMYFGTGVFWDGGHESAGVNEASTSWFHAEGATGPFFDTFILLSNPNAAPAAVTLRFLLDTGETVLKTKTIAANSRLTVIVENEDSKLANASMATQITSTLPIVSERAMYWAQYPNWYEAHNSFGVTSTGTKWALADGEVGGASSVQTYILVANTSAFADSVRVTVLFEDGTSSVRAFTVAANARFNVDVGVEFPSTAGRRFGAIVESLGATPAQLVVERSMYSNASGVVWAAGTNCLATRLP